MNHNSHSRRRKPEEYKKQNCHPENVENEVANRSFQVVQDLKKKIDAEINSA